MDQEAHQPAQRGEMARCAARRQAACREALQPLADDRQVDRLEVADALALQELAEASEVARIRLDGVSAQAALDPGVVQKSVEQDLDGHAATVMPSCAGCKEPEDGC